MIMAPGKDSGNAGIIVKAADPAGKRGGKILHRQ